MTKRAWWLVVLNLLIPGSAQVLAGNRRGGRFGLGATLVLWVVVVVVVLLYFLNRTVLLTVFTNSIVLWIVVAALIFYAVLWIVLTFDTHLTLTQFAVDRPSWARNWSMSTRLPSNRSRTHALSASAIFWASSRPTNGTLSSPPER